MQLGRAGSEIKKELLLRGHEVLGIARDPSKVEPADGLTVVKGVVPLIYEEISILIKGVEVVVNAYAPPFGNETELSDFTKQLDGGAAQAKVERVIMVGGAGTLKIGDGEDDGYVVDQPWLPPEWLGYAKAHVEALAVLKNSRSLWTAITPPAYLEVGPRRGTYRTGTDSLVYEVLEDGTKKSSISYADFAIALVDEIDQRKYLNTRFTVGY